MSGLIDKISGYFCFAVSGVAFGVAAASLGVIEVTPAAAALSSIAMVSSVVQAAIRCNRYSLTSLACAAFSMVSIGFLVSYSLIGNNTEHIAGVACSGVAFVINAVMIGCRARKSEAVEQIV